MIRKYILLALGMMVLSPAFGQAWTKFTLENAYQMLEERYPVLKNSELLKEIHQKESEQLEKSRLPSVSLKADGRLQSESTSLGAEAGSQFPIQIDLPLYSAKSYLELNYNILDGGQTTARQKVTDAQTEVDQQMLEVDRYALRSRVDLHFVNMILLREQLKLFDF